MKRIQLTEELSVSQIVHGHWRINDWQLSAQSLLDLAKTAHELGITTIDHADIYGNYTCEELFGAALRLDPAFRHELQIISKCGIQLLSDKFPDRRVKHYDYSEAHIVQSVENSLHNFGTDYLDVLLLHRPSPLYQPEEIAAAFDTLHSTGKVRAFGVSNFSPQQFETLQHFVNQPLVTNQIEISPMHLAPFTDGTMDYFLQKRIRPMAWSPLKGGRLFSGMNLQAIELRSKLIAIAERKGIQSIEALVYAWLLAHPTGIMPIVGSGKPERLATAVAAFQCELTTAEWFEIYEAGLGKEVP